MKLKWLWVVAVVIGAQSNMSAAEQESLSPEEIKALRRQIDQLEQKVKRLEEQSNPPEPKAPVAGFITLEITGGSDGFGVLQDHTAR